MHDGLSAHYENHLEILLHLRALKISSIPTSEQEVATNLDFRKYTFRTITAKKMLRLSQSKYKN